MSHTKGPWSYKAADKLYSSSGFVVVNGNGEILTLGGCGCRSFPDGSIQNEDDARLMAGAPALLAALEESIAYIQQSVHETGSRKALHCLIRAKKAIRKSKLQQCLEEFMVSEAEKNHTEVSNKNQNLIHGNGLGDKESAK
jgi:hypothetical protein